jgi:hypothetical protein
MRENHSKKINQTFSLPREVSMELHTYVRSRERSEFVARAIRKEIEVKKEELRKAYRASRKDQGQLETKEWDSTIGDGSDTW